MYLLRHSQHVHREKHGAVQFWRTKEHLQKNPAFPSLRGVAVNWIFSSRIKYVGLEVILGVMTVVGGSGLFLTFWRSLGGPPGEQDVLKTRF